MRQIGIGLHLYHDSKKKFPPGLSSNNDPNYPYMTWLARILPFIEEENVWQETESAYARSRNPFVAGQHPAFQRVVPSFTCATETRMSMRQFARSNRLVGLTSYVGVIGISGEEPNGVLAIDSRTKMASITDGTSNTLVVGERPPSSDFYYGWWYAGYGRNGLGTPDMILGVRENNLNWDDTSQCDPGPFNFAHGKENEFCDLFHFWSLHSKGANFMFADGSVRFLTYESNHMFPNWATIRGGETNQRMD